LNYVVIGLLKTHTSLLCNGLGLGKLWWKCGGDCAVGNRWWRR